MTADNKSTGGGPMEHDNQADFLSVLNKNINDKKRHQALRRRCEQYRSNLHKKNPQEVAGKAAMRIGAEENGSYTLYGEHFLEQYYIQWPSISVKDSNKRPASLLIEALWLHYLDRADGCPLTGRWVNLSEIGGLFYQQAFQGYSGDQLAEAWGGDIAGLKQKCLAAGGWALPGMADLAFEWRALPRMPVCLCYRLPVEDRGAWATVLFDASSGHYVAADVAATVGKTLADRLMPDQVL
jgi:hypothetical protein